MSYRHHQTGIHCLVHCRKFFFNQRGNKKVLPLASAVVIGPGIGLSKQSEELVEYVLTNTKVPTVVDGDAITICAKKILRFGIILS